MFAKLTGKIDTLLPEGLILDVGGVGYLVFASGRTLGMIGQVGDGASLLIETHVREDHIHLYGFSSVAEREWFKLLTSVQGVGAKSGLAILSVCTPEQLPLVIASGDAALLRRADGVGPKLATRICTELKDKVQGMNLGAAVLSSSAVEPEIKASSKKSPKVASVAAVDGFPNLDQDVLSALVNLGYGRAEAFSAVVQARRKANDNNEVLGLESLIRLALKELTQ
ncbi:MAG: Holliday junction branch migration protein RuvA [Pseudobdellovibrionaceae bacterium]